MNVAPKGAVPNSLKYRLHKALAYSRPGRSLSVLHASDMTQDRSFCPRERLIMGLSGVRPGNEFISASRMMTFALGNAIEDIVVDYAASGGLAVGDWKCVACGNEHLMQLRPVKCAACGKSVRYAQRRFQSFSSGISCGVDLLVSGLGPKFKIVEVKSIAQEAFRKLVAPLAEHRLRTNLYMRTVAESVDPDTNKIDTSSAIVLYVDKGGFGVKDETTLDWKLGDGGFSPFKEFSVLRNDAETETITLRARAYLDAVSSMTICGGVCLSPMDPNAKGCAVAQKCFGSSFPVGGKF